MSGIHQMLLASGPLGAETDFGGSYERETLGGATSAAVRFQTNGQITRSGTGTVLVDSVGAAWFFPLTTVIGSLRWIRATLNSGSAPTSGALGTIQQMNVERVWSNTQSVLGSRVSNLTIEIFEDAAGVKLLKSQVVIIRATFAS